MSVISTILNEWSHRLNDGQPDVKNPEHLTHLVKACNELKFTPEFVNELINTLVEANDDAKKAEADAKSKEVAKEKEDKAKEASDKAEEIKATKETEKASKDVDKEKEGDSTDVETNLWDNDPKGGLTDAEYEALHPNEDSDEDIEEPIDEYSVQKNDGTNSFYIKEAGNTRWDLIREATVPRDIMNVILTEEVEQDEWLMNAKDILRKESGLPDSILTVFEKKYLELKPSAQKYVQTNFRKMSVSKCVSSFSSILGKLPGWNMIMPSGSRVGMGEGEFLLQLFIKGARSGGTAELDLHVGGKTYEVKKTDSSGYNIMLATSGNSANSPAISKLRKLVSIVENFDHTNATSDISKLTVKYITSDMNSRVMQGDKLTGKILQRYYDFFNEAGPLIKAGVAPKTYLTIGNADTYYITDKEASKIKPNTKVELNILGTTSEDFSEQYSKMLSDYEYVKTPLQFPKDLHEIVNVQYSHASGFIVFPAKSKISYAMLLTSPKDWIAHQVTTSKFKIAVASLLSGFKGSIYTDQTS